MNHIDQLRLLGDQVLVKCLGTASMQGQIHIPETAKEARKIHQSGGDYVHRGQVVKVGPGNKTTLLICSTCSVKTFRTQRRIVVDANVFSLGKCNECGGNLNQMIDGAGCTIHRRTPMPVAVGDIVLYENRRDAELRETRFELDGLAGESFVVLLGDQHVFAVLDDEAVAA